MLIALYFLMVNVVLPQLGEIASEILEPLMIIVITIAGVVIVFGAVGMRISNNLGSTVIGTVLRGIGYLLRTLIHAIGWLARYIVIMIPIAFRETRNVLLRGGMNEIVANIIAVFCVIVLVAIII